MHETAKELIERYLFAVGEQLPRKLRDDVLMELRGLIEDKIEDRAKASGAPVDSAFVGYILQEIGEPGEVARRYDTSPQYLIGPRYYRIFMKFVKIGLPILGGLILVSTLVGHMASPEGRESLITLATLRTIMGQYFQAALSLFAQAVIIVALIDRFATPRTMTSPRRWSPQALPTIPQLPERQGSIAGLAIEMCMTIIALVVLNLYPAWIGVMMVRGGKITLIPFVSLGIYLPMYAINIWLTLLLVLKFEVLRQQHWTRTTRWAQVGLGLFSAAVLFQIASRSELHPPVSVPQLDEPFRMLGTLLYLAPLGAVVGAVLNAVRLLRERPHLAPARQ